MLRHVTTRVAGLTILIAGLWGGLIPYIGPYFHFTLGPDHAWRWTTGRLWLVVLPAAASVLGGLILTGGGPRVSGRLGALIALAGGAWFAVGPDVSRVWNHGVSVVGIPHGHHAITRMLEFLTLHTGIGVLITALAAYSLPGVAAYAVGRRHRVAEDAALAGTGAAAGAAETRHRDRVAAREGAAAPVAEREGVAPVAEREGVAPVAEREGVAGTGTPATAPAEEPAGGPVAEEPVGGRAAEEPVGGPVPPYSPTGTAPTNEEPMAADEAAAGQPGAGRMGQATQTRPRRRGGLFSRR